jgi:hypothetical protein
LDRRLGGPQNRCGRRREEENLAPTWDSNSNPSVVHPIASHYTDGAILAPAYGEDIEVKAVSYFQVRLLGFLSIFLVALSDLGTKNLLFQNSNLKYPKYVYLAAMLSNAASTYVVLNVE